VSALLAATEKAARRDPISRRRRGLPRDRWFESGFLQRRVCELSVPERCTGRSENEFSDTIGIRPTVCSLEGSASEPSVPPARKERFPALYRFGAGPVPERREVKMGTSSFSPEARVCQREDAGVGAAVKDVLCVRQRRSRRGHQGPTPSHRGSAQQPVGHPLLRVMQDQSSPPHWT
jgi:hypothetical protein